MTVVQTEWYLDFEEEWSSDTGLNSTHTWSAGPIELDHDSVMSVEDWVFLVNQKLEDAYISVVGSSGDADDDSTYVHYKLGVETYFPHAIGSPGIQASANTAGEESFVINYRLIPFEFSPTRPVSHNWLRSYAIKFRDGPNGYAQPANPYGGTIPRGLVTWRNYSDTRVAVLPYISKAVTIIDKPPLPPHLRVVPYTGVSNRLLLLLNSNTGEYSARPIAIKDSDTVAISDLYFAQTNNNIAPPNIRAEIADPNSPLTIEYANDDPINKYEVFRLATRPTSYEDFNTVANPHQVLTGQITTDKETSAAFLIDEIEPNTKYYYCARAIDVHNNFSNPTHVFEAELVDNDGQVYLILNTIMFETDMSGLRTKQGRRFLYIEPSVRNLNIQSMPPTTSATNENPGGVHGAATGTDCWNKTFKVRLTSKKSNKKIDLNILFKNTGVINP